jgi:DNA-binding transcriptional LysR family regulator
MRYTFRQLEYFVAAAETESVTLAAARMNISQTSISGAIAHFEHEIGAALFIRDHTRGLSITPLGVALLQEAKRLLEQGEHLHRSVVNTSARLRAEHLGSRLRGALAIGCLVAIAHLLLPELIQGFRKLSPDLQIDGLELQPEELFAALRNRSIQAALTFGWQIPQDVVFTPLAGLPLLAWIGQSHPLAQASTVDLEDLAASDLILHDAPIARDVVLALFREHGLTPRVTKRSSQLEFVRTLVANGEGYTLSHTSPRCEFASDGRHVLRKVLSIDHWPMQLGIAFGRNADLSPAQMAFEIYSRTVVSDRYVPGMIAPAAALGRRGPTKSELRDERPAVSPSFDGHDSANPYEQERHQQS